MLLVLSYTRHPFTLSLDTAARAAAQLRLDSPQIHSALSGWLTMLAARIPGLPWRMVS